MGSKGTRHGKITLGGKAAARNNGSSRRPRRDQTAAALQEVPSSGRGGKDRNNYCKPGHGPHTPVIMFVPMGAARCHQPGWWPEIGWMCWHEERCEKCGKVLRRNISESECPDWSARQAHQLAGAGSS